MYLEAVFSGNRKPLQAADKSNPNACFIPVL